MPLLPGAHLWCLRGPTLYMLCLLRELPEFHLMEVSRETWHIPHPSWLLPEHGARDHLCMVVKTKNGIFLPGHL